MKKILTLALCLAAIGSASAQQDVVKQAKKTASKNLTEARKLIRQAASNPETSKQAETYYVGGKMEFDAYDDAYKRQAINPQDPSINVLDMGNNLIYGYDMYMQALPLDSLPDAKGKVKPKYSKDIYNTVFGHHNDFFNCGGYFYNNQKYYPEAYNAFMIHADLTQMPNAPKNIKNIPDSTVNMSYFNAGVSAYAGKELEPAIKAFKAARKNNTDNDQNYIYEIACWQYLAQEDSSLQEPAKVAILEIASDGYKKFGMSNMLFLNNLINSLVLDNKLTEAVATIDSAIEKYPNNAALYGLRGYVLDRMDRDDDSVDAYRKAAELPGADFETLKNAAKKIFKVGTLKWDKIEGATKEQREAIKKDYFLAAKAITEKAKAINAEDNDLNYVIENIDYAIETFFN